MNKTPGLYRVALCAAGGGERRREAYTGVGGHNARDRREASRGNHGVQKHLDFFTEPARKRRSETEGGGGVCLDTAPSQKHRYRLSR